MHFQQQTAVDGLERSVGCVRRPACVGVGWKALAAFSLFIVADDQIARDEINLFPVFMRERRSGVDARFETQQSRTRAAPIGFVQPAGKNLLLNSRRITRRDFPAAVHVQRVKLVMLLIDWHLGVSRLN